MQQKTQRPVQFEITEQTRGCVEAWIEARGLKAADFLFPSRLHTSPHLSTRQYARTVHRWVASIGLDDTAYGTHTMRRTTASLLGQTKLESTVRYLGIKVDDALEMAEQTDLTYPGRRAVACRPNADVELSHPAVRLRRPDILRFTADN